MKCCQIRASNKIPPSHPSIAGAQYSTVLCCRLRGIRQKIYCAIGSVQLLLGRTCGWLPSRSSLAHVRKPLRAVLCAVTMQVLPSLLDLSTEQLIHLHQMQVGVTLGKFFDRIFKPAAVERGQGYSLYSINLPLSFHSPYMMPRRVLSINFFRRLSKRGRCFFLICIVSIRTRRYKDGKFWKFRHTMGSCRRADRISSSMVKPQATCRAARHAPYQSCAPIVPCGGIVPCSVPTTSCLLCAEQNVGMPRRPAFSRCCQSSRNTSPPPLRRHTRMSRRS